MGKIQLQTGNMDFRGNDFILFFLFSLNPENLESEENEDVSKVCVDSNV